MSKQILLENAYLSWIDAVNYARLLKDGVSALGYKKRFVSSLHNAVELFLKQIMLDQCDYRVAKLKGNVSKSGDPLKQFYMSEDLNEYFLGLSSEERNKFYTIEFNDLIQIFKEEISLTPNCAYGIQMLNKLRNNETHFFIKSEEYLNDREFIELYNFMVDFYNQLGDFNLLPWAFGRGYESSGLIFEENKISQFCYSSAIKRSVVTKILSDAVNKNVYQGSNTDNAILFTGYIWEYVEEDMYSFDRTVAYVESLFNAGAIKFIPVTETAPEELGGGEILSYYEVRIKTLS